MRYSGSTAAAHDCFCLYGFGSIALASFLNLVATALVGLFRNLVYRFQAPDDLSSANVKSLLLSLQDLSLVYLTI